MSDNFAALRECVASLEGRSSWFGQDDSSDAFYIDDRDERKFVAAASPATIWAWLDEKARLRAALTSAIEECHSSACRTQWLDEARGALEWLAEARAALASGEERK